MGVHSSSAGLAFFPQMPRESGSVGLISQSGSLCNLLMKAFEPRKLFFRHAVSYGNGCDVDLPELLEWMGRQPDIRLICATNMPIYDMVKNNEFRQDLLYRINTVELHLPPLRERQEDIQLLAEHFVEMYCRKYRKQPKSVSANAVKKLQKYQWPGNIRELQHAIERAIIMTDNNVLDSDDFFFLSQNSQSEDVITDTYNLETVERSVIQKAVTKYNGNISKAAKELGLTRASLYRRLEKHGL